MSILNCIIFGLQGESFKSFGDDCFFVCLIILISHYLSFCLGWGCLIDLLVRYISSQIFIQFFGLFRQLNCIILNISIEELYLLNCIIFGLQSESFNSFSDYCFFCVFGYFNFSFFEILSWLGLFN